MLQHHTSSPTSPTRVVVLGARGFLGSHLTAHLTAAKTPCLAIGSDILDLTAPEAADHLAALLAPDDALVVLSAITPDKGRDIDTMMRNLAMARNVCSALTKRPCAQVIYISSDAVYPFTAGLVNEDSPAAPTDLYGMMHRAREIMFESTVTAPLAIVRPTLVYGADDSHNSYGPNRFRRQAAKEGKISLGGEGEETRDHIHVDDAVRMIELCLRHRSSGYLNLASGRSISFLALAKLITKLFDKPVEIALAPRTSPITHRSFDITACRKAFPTFTFTSLEEGLATTHREMIALT